MLEPIQISINLGKTFLGMPWLRKLQGPESWQRLCIFTFFVFPDSGLYLLNGFDFYSLIYFEWRDTENHQICFDVESIYNIFFTDVEGEVGNFLTTKLKILFYRHLFFCELLTLHDVLSLFLVH